MRRILAVWAGLGVVAPLSAQAGPRVEVGSRVRRRGAVGGVAGVGGLVGLIAGGIAGAAVGKECIGDNGSCLHQRHVVWERALALTGAGVLIGAVIGARSRHVWARAAWSVTPTPSPEGTGLGLGVSLHFAVGAGRSP